MKLPNAEHATIDIAKLRDYCLNPRHPRGRHKSRAFRAALGYTDRQAEELRDAILFVLPNAEAHADREDVHGQRYTADCPITGPSGSAVVRTAWIIHRSEVVPRLTTCFVL